MSDKMIDTMYMLEVGVLRSASAINIENFN